MKQKVLIGSILIICAVVAAYLLFPVIASTVAGTSNPEKITAPPLKKTHTPASNGIHVGVKGVHPGEFILNTSLNAAAPTEILVYRPLPPDVSRNHILDLARKFGINGTIREGEDGIAIGSEDHVAHIMIGNNSGRVEYTHHESYNQGSVDLDGLPQMSSREEALRITTAFLKDRDLFPENALPAKVGFSTSHMSAPNGTDVSWNSSVMVRFDRGPLNNLSMIGPDRVDVEMVMNREITYYWSLWRNYEPYKSYPIKPPVDAYEELKLQGVFDGLRQSIVPDKVIINNVYLAYFSKSAVSKEDYLTPVYVFEGTCYGHYGNKSQVVEVTENIPALWEEPAELVSSS